MQKVCHHCFVNGRLRASSLNRRFWTVNTKGVVFVTCVKQCFYEKHVFKKDTFFAPFSKTQSFEASRECENKKKWWHKKWKKRVFLVCQKRHLFCVAMQNHLFCDYPALATFTKQWWHICVHFCAHKCTQKNTFFWKFDFWPFLRKSQSAFLVKKGLFYENGSQKSPNMAKNDQKCTKTTPFLFFWKNAQENGYPKVWQFPKNDDICPFFDHFLLFLLFFWTPAQSLGKITFFREPPKKHVFFSSFEKCRAFNRLGEKSEKRLKIVSFWNDPR